MKQFALIHDKNRNTILGSDKLIYIDGRFNIHSALAMAKTVAISRIELHPDIYSVRIYKGTLSNNRAISGYHIINFSLKGEIKE